VLVNLTQQGVHHHGCSAGVEVAGGFVGQQQAGGVGQGAGHGHPLLLAAGELGRLVLHAFGQAQFAQQGRRPGLGGLARHAGDHQRHGYVVEGRELRQQVVELVDETQLVIAQLPPGRFRKRIQALAGHGHPAGIGLIQPAQQVQQRALARA